MKIKRLLAALFGFVLIVSMFSGCGETPGEDSTNVDDFTLEGRKGEIWEITSDMSIDEAIELEKRNYKIVLSMEPLYDADTYSEYYKAYLNMRKNNDQMSVDSAIEARKKLVLTSTVEDRIWFLWGDNIPLVDGETYTEEELDKSQEDAYGAEPFIIKYLLDDPSKAKGNLVIVSGGAFKVRANHSEGYPAAKVFNDLGYNVFLLQRRVEPYSQMDTFMDYQRAVRMVRYYAEKEGYGGQDMIAGVGWSGGGATVMGAIDNCYGDLTPKDEGDSSYVPDDIDGLSSDLDVAMILYGSFDGTIGTANKNWPAFYICTGTADTTVDPVGSQKLYDNVKDKVPALLNLIEGAEHGFGVGTPPSTGIAPGCELWPAQADVFMQENRESN